MKLERNYNSHLKCFYFFPVGGSMSASGSHDIRLFELSKSVHWILDPSGERKRRIATGDDSDDDDINKPYLSSDIYRARQRKKIK